MSEREKEKFIFICSDCSKESLQWSGQCMNCGSWNSLRESKKTKRDHLNSLTELHENIELLSGVNSSSISRVSTGIGELDRTLGGGVVPGSVTLLGGDPGVGKSTLALQWAGFQSEKLRVLYVTAEESLQQLALRAERLQLNHRHISAMSDNYLENILAQLGKYEFIVIDSIQALTRDATGSISGSVVQIRECAEQLTKTAKANNCSLLIIGHVTKEGALAGPKVLEHIVDTVLYFEGEGATRFRLVRCFKNRFGNVNEIAIFNMTDKGLQEVGNPSAMFLSGVDSKIPGSVVLATQEGTRPLMIEVQALVDPSSLANPRRLCVGLDTQRLVMLLAVLHRHADMLSGNYDVFLNVVGGIRIVESGADIAVCAAIVSSFLGKQIPSDTACFGEVGLAGEIRPVQRGEARLREAEKLGFKRALVPATNKITKKIQNFEIVRIERIIDLIDWINSN